MAILYPQDGHWLVGGTKHRGRMLEDVARVDPSYLKWIFLKASVDLSDDAFNALSDVLEKYRIDPHKKDRKPDPIDYRKKRKRRVN